MKKELLKGFSMVTLVIVIAFAAAVVSASAQSNKLVIADIPFDFVVADEAMPAGEYRVRTASAQGDGLLIQSADAKHSAIRLTNSVESKKTNARLVFRRYGERYFLAEVWNGADSTGRQLTRSKQERAIQRELAAIQSKSELAQSTYAIVEVLVKVR